MAKKLVYITYNKKDILDPLGISKFADSKEFVLINHYRLMEMFALYREKNENELFKDSLLVMNKFDELWVYGREQFTAKDNPENKKDTVPIDSLDDIVREQVKAWEKPLTTIKYFNTGSIPK